MNTATNVTAGKPKIGGAIFRAPLGTTLPTDATTALSAAWKSIGYSSDDGLTNSNTRESKDIKSWGGDTVLTIQTSKDDKVKMTWIESLNADVLKAVHGDANVSGTLATGITVKVNSKELTAGSYVIDMALRDDAIKRIVIPNASVSEVGDVVYSDEDVVGYPVTLTCMPDAQGNTHYEYILRQNAANVYSVTQNLSHVTSSFDGDSATAGDAFSATLTADSTYTIDTVIVLMGGEDVTSTAWDSDTSKVTIASVSGNISITATATV